MKKLVAVAIASALAFGSLSSFAAGYTNDRQVPAQHQVVNKVHNTKHWHNVKHAKKHGKRHFKRNHRRY
ncbi:MAG: hypothetical protein ACXWCY_17750 [Burkholderiales bacterium]